MHEAEVRMDIGFENATVMGRIERNRLFLDGPTSWSVGNVCSIVHYCWLFGRSAQSVTHVGNLIHVQPNSWEGYLIVEIAHHIFPILGRIGMEIIRKLNRASPYLSDQKLPISSLDVYISFCSLAKGIAQSSNAWLHNRNVLVLFNDGSQSIEWKFFSIDCKGLELVHVINIWPDSVKRNTVGFVFGNHVFQSGDVFVSPAALMETQWPKGRNQRISNICMELRK